MQSLVVYLWLRVGVSIERTKRCVVASIVLLAVSRLMRHVLASSSGLMSARRSPEANVFTWYLRYALRAVARDHDSMAWDIDRETEFTSMAITVCLLLVARGLRSECRASWPR